MGSASANRVRTAWLGPVICEKARLWTTAITTARSIARAASAPGAVNLCARSRGHMFRCWCAHEYWASHPRRQSAALRRTTPAVRMVPSSCVRYGQEMALSAQRQTYAPHGDGEEHLDVPLQQSKRCFLHSHDAARDDRSIRSRHKRLRRVPTHTGLLCRGGDTNDALEDGLKHERTPIANENKHLHSRVLSQAAATHMQIKRAWQTERTCQIFA